MNFRENDKVHLLSALSNYSSLSNYNGDACFAFVLKKGQQGRVVRETYSITKGKNIIAVEFVITKYFSIFIEVDEFMIEKVNK